MTSASATLPQGLERVVVINDVSIVRGGATKVALTSAQMMGALGAPVTVLAGDTGTDAGFTNVTVEGAGERHILERGRLNSLANGVYNHRANHFVSSWIAHNDTPGTVYHLHGWSKILSPSVFVALKPVSSRLVIAAHDFFLACPNGAYFDFRAGVPCSRTPLSVSCLTTNCDRRNYAQKLWRSARQATLRLLNDFSESGSPVVTVHEGMHEHLARGGIASRRLQTLRNPVDPWSARRIEAERNGVFVFVGRLEEDKGVRLLASAARRAGVRLRLIGAGPLGDTIARDFPEVEQIGWKSGDDLKAAVADARALVMPSRYREPFGIVALEAAMSGLPVILSDYALLAPEMVAGGFALARNPHDEAGFAAALALLAGDPGLVARMSRAGHSGARSLAPTPDAWIAALLALYGRLLAPVAEARLAWPAAARGAIQPSIAGGPYGNH